MAEFISNHLLDIFFCLLTLGGGIAATILLGKKASQTHSYQLRSYIPTVWTSLGIFFTFVSIYISLMWKFNGNDIEQLVYSLVPAFSTSILGIAGAVWTSIRNKWKLSNEEKSDIDKFNELNKLIPLHRQTNSPELVLFEIVDAIRRGIDSVVKNTNENQKQIMVETEKRASALTTLLNNLNEKTIASISNALQQQKKDFETTIGWMEKSFQDALDKQNDSISLEMRDLNKMLKDEIEQMQAKNGELISKLVEAESKLLEITKNELANESKNRNEQLQTFITDATTRLSSFIDEQLQQYNGINGNMNALVSDIRNLFEKDVKDTINQFAEHELKVSAETITLCNNKLIADASDYLNNHMSAISVYLSNLDNQTKTTYESFKETVNGIAQTIASKLQELYDQQMSLIGGTIDNNRGQIESALSTNSESIQTILNANKTAIERVSNEIKADNSSIKAELAATQKRWKDVAEKIEADHLGKVVEIHTHTEAEILDIQNRIISIGNKLQEKLDRIEKETTRSIFEFENMLNEVKEDSVGQSEKTIKELNAQIQKALQVETLQNASVKLSTNIGETLGRFDESTSKINQNLQAVAKSINDSSEKYAATIQEYDDKLGYIESTLNTIKQHITSVCVLEGVLKDVNEAVLRVEKMRDDVKRDALIRSESHKSSRAKKQES